MMNNTFNGLELAQIAWVVPEIYATTRFLRDMLRITDFPEPEQMNAQDLGMTYRGSIVPGSWLTTQTYNGGTFLELIQPLSGQSMFHDYLRNNPGGGTQHCAFRVPVTNFEDITNGFRQQGYEIVSEVNHPIARMAFFDTYRTMGFVTEIMGITPEGEIAIEQMKKTVNAELS